MANRFYFSTSFLFQFYFFSLNNYERKKNHHQSIDTFHKWLNTRAMPVKNKPHCRSVMEALRMGLSSMALGATNSGKTETLKDLTKAVGKKGIVYNCNRTLDCIVLGKFFKVCIVRLAGVQYR